MIAYLQRTLIIYIIKQYAIDVYRHVLSDLNDYSLHIYIIYINLSTQVLHLVTASNANMPRDQIHTMQ